MIFPTTGLLVFFALVALLLLTTAGCARSVVVEVQRIDADGKACSRIAYVKVTNHVMGFHYSVDMGE